MILRPSGIVNALPHNVILIECWKLVEELDKIVEMNGSWHWKGPSRSHYPPGTNCNHPSEKGRKKINLWQTQLQPCTKKRKSGEMTGLASTSESKKSMIMIWPQKGEKSSTLEHSTPKANRKFGHACPISKKVKKLRAFRYQWQGQAPHQNWLRRTYAPVTPPQTALELKQASPRRPKSAKCSGWTSQSPQRRSLHRRS